MVTIKVKLHQSSTTADNIGELYYQIGYNHKVRTIRTGIRIYPYEWNKKYEEIILPAKGLKRKLELTEIRNKIKEGLLKLNRTAARLSKEKPYYTIDDIIASYRETSNDYNLGTLMKKIIAEKKERGKWRTADNYTAALKSFMRFRNYKDIMIEEINSSTIIEYENYLKKRSVSLNTISFYMRILRAVYNYAAEKELTKQNYPFRKVYTGIAKTIKRAANIETIKRIKQLDLSKDPITYFARDMFLFSLYTRGMSYIDMANLKSEDINNGILTYRRRKTGKELFIRWEPCMQEIINKYIGQTKDGRLLPIIRNTTNIKREYENSLRLINKKLKVLGKLVESNIPLTMYVARHSWASIAKSKYISISIISEAMGHSNEKTTQIYLASFENRIIDDANKIIINDILQE